MSTVVGALHSQNTKKSTTIFCTQKNVVPALALGELHRGEIAHVEVPQFRCFEQDAQQLEMSSKLSARTLLQLERLDDARRKALRRQQRVLQNRSRSWPSRCSSPLRRRRSNYSNSSHSSARAYSHSQHSCRCHTR